VLDGASTLTVSSGAPGGAGSANGAEGGPAGSGGDARFTVERDLVAARDVSLVFQKGAAKGGATRRPEGGRETRPAGAAVAGALQVAVGRNLEILEGRRVTMEIAGAPMTDADSVSFGTLVLHPGAEFRTGAHVYTDRAPAGANGYRVASLDVIAGGTWETSGTFRPDSAHGGYMRFDMKDAEPGAVLASIKGSGSVSLAAFDPMAQHEAYLASPGRPSRSDDPAYRDYPGASDAPAFITSPYGTKRLHLGQIVLIDRISGYGDIPAALADEDGKGRKHYRSTGSASGPLHDGFAFTAGLRRHYWDVYAESEAAGGRLVAENSRTADASLVYALGSFASLELAHRTGEASLAALESAARAGHAGRWHLGAAASASDLRTWTGSRVDLKARHLTVSLSYRIAHGPDGAPAGSRGETILGIFGESGTGSYDTSASVPGYGVLHAAGDAEIRGAGLFVRTASAGGLFLEASARAGRVENSFRLEGDPWAALPRVHDADFAASYEGFHLGLGKAFALSERVSLVAYARYYRTRIGECSSVTAAGDPITLSPAVSSRLRVGLGADVALGDTGLGLHFGIAGEREFDGRASGLNGIDRFAGGPDPRGTSAIAELGLSWKPAPGVTVTAAGFGVSGRQKGGGGTLSLGFSF
jgi:hypothetical protein